MLRLAFIGLLLGITGQAIAQDKGDSVLMYVSGLDLKTQCEKNRQFCYGYTAAMTDTILVLDVLDRGPKICMPQGVQLEQVVLVITKYLNDNPDKLHIIGSTLASRAIVDAFPCKR
ncbi:Rap1a/Tai family immunity protein [Ferrovibrio sp.]|uniref:Rap1a/Tai family immunity protein n=1 Tax=Ferrovibrio sp. TaxID=1917215 RepID=UPI000CA6BE88|nr:Rap1a/Tai family immunity protein [Ferrovibrio sp.]PJI40399.1 MAG: hypothetical protein CTR53_10335 [Ferrovibrio sp.]